MNTKQQGKHTPGPWIIDHENLTIDGGDKQICAIVNYSQSAYKVTDEANANTRLIAAAPELYEACISARNAVINNNGQMGKETIELVLNAIEMASGR